jgi:hypothetical protein
MAERNVGTVRWRWPVPVPKCFGVNVNFAARLHEGDDGRKRLRKVTVNLSAVQATDERHGLVLENKADPVIAQANPVVLAGRFEAFEVGNLLERRGGFDLFNHSLDAAQQCCIGDFSQRRRQMIREKRPSRPA